MSDRDTIHAFEDGILRIFRSYNEYIKVLKAKLAILHAVVREHNVGELPTLNENLKEARGYVELQVALLSGLRSLLTDERKRLPTLIGARYGLTPVQQTRIIALLTEFEKRLSLLDFNLKNQEAFFANENTAILFRQNEAKYRELLSDELANADPAHDHTHKQIEDLEKTIKEEISYLQEFTRIGEADELNVGNTADSTLYADMQHVIHDLSEVLRMQLEPPRNDAEQDVIVIGGGSSGLACVAALLDHKGGNTLRILCIDQQGRWGGNWLQYPPTMYMNSGVGNRRGNDADTVSIPQCTLAGAGIDTPEDGYLNMGQMGAYVQRVAEKIGLPTPTKDIVTRVRRVTAADGKPNHQYAVETITGRVYYSTFVILGTGIFDSPTFPDLKNFYANADEFIDIRRFNDLHNNFDVCTADDFFMHYQSSSRDIKQNSVREYIRSKRAVAVVGPKLTGLKLTKDLLDVARAAGQPLVVFSISRNEPAYALTEVGINEESQRIREHLFSIAQSGENPSICFEPYTESITYYHKATLQNALSFFQGQLGKRDRRTQEILLQKKAEYRTYPTNDIHKSALAKQFRREEGGNVILQVDGIVYAIGYSASTSIVDPALLKTDRGYIPVPTTAEFSTINPATRESNHASGLFVTGIIADTPMRKVIGIAAGSFTQAAVRDAQAICQCIHARIQNQRAA